MSWTYTPSRVAIASGIAPFSYTTNEEDEYYLAFSQVPSNIGVATIRLSIEQFQPTVSNLTSHPSCSVTGYNDECTIPVPLGQYNRALIENTARRFTWNCSNQDREWAYPVILLACILFVALVVVIVGLLALFCYKLKKSTKEAETTQSTSPGPKGSQRGDHDHEMTEKSSSDATMPASSDCSPGPKGSQRGDHDHEMTEKSSSAATMPASSDCSPDTKDSQRGDHDHEMTEKSSSAATMPASLDCSPDTKDSQRGDHDHEMTEKSSSATTMPASLEKQVPDDEAA